MNKECEIIECEIDRTFHKIMFESDGTPGKGFLKCKALAEELKAILPEYIDNQCNLIGRRNEYVASRKKVQEESPDITVEIPKD